ncbi:MAG: methylenetetrahydrofolate reductase C-terminal domain-containing protein [Candidatus Saganbacteria bacterium]|nr:methylenetetrahydrofolate reductase C-terminal domain-containing protein [Candidatus Saganbacteria bacterium]
MIVTEQKKIEEILGMLKESKSIFIAGCGSCATTTNTGGEEQVREMKKALEKAGKRVTGTKVIESTCDERLCKKDLKDLRKEMDEADTFLVMSCGAGSQTIADLIGKKTFPALNSMFLARVERAGKFYEMCTTCGDCQLDKTGGICLITRCAKNTLNGPCGGSVEGKCEVNKENDCAWAIIEERLKQINSVSDIRDFRPVKDWSAALRPRKVEK